MEFLKEAIAYRQDWEARESWANRRTDSIPVGCPKGCTVEYDLIVCSQASEGDVNRWIETIHRQMERQCPNHVDSIRF